VWYFRIVVTVWYFRIVVTVWYSRIVVTVWYFRIVVTVWYFWIVVTVWYFRIVVTVWYLRIVMELLQNQWIQDFCDILWFLCIYFRSIINFYWLIDCLVVIANFKNSSAIFVNKVETIKITIGVYYVIDLHGREENVPDFCMVNIQIVSNKGALHLPKENLSLYYNYIFRNCKVSVISLQSLNLK
jgi:hypothetical protein